MKRGIALFLALIVSCLLLVSCGEQEAQAAADTDLEVETFVLREDRHLLERAELYPADENVGPVLTAEEAVEKAVEVWVERYGSQIKEQAPYRVFYDETEDLWYIRGKDLPKNYVGGWVEILIERSTGRVRFVWFGD